MNQKILWLRISYWWGIMLDAMMAIMMLYPKLFTLLLNIDTGTNKDFGYGIRFGAPLMLGWTILLFWADRKPLERKAILPITMFPGLLGFIMVEFYSVITGFNLLAQLAPTMILQAVTIVFFGYSYHHAGKRNPETGSLGASKQS